MRYSLFAVAFYACFSTAAHASFFDDAPPPAVAGAGVQLEPVFSPAELPSNAIVKAIAGAKKSIRVSVRDFTSKPVSEALVKASRSNIDVKVLLDKKANENIASAANFLMTMSFFPHVPKADKLIYASYVIIDERDVILGNIAPLLDATEEKKTDASALIIHNAPELAKKYLSEWQAEWDASEEMKKPKD